MGTISLAIPQSGELNASADPKVSSDLTILQILLNGNLDSANIAGSLAQSASVNYAGQTVKGAANISASQSTSSTSYTTLGTPDQVAGIVLPTNGLIRVRYQATWQESVLDAARAAIFIGSNQLKFCGAINVPQTQAAQLSNGAGITNANVPLISTNLGLMGIGFGAGSYSGDVTTGQVVGGLVGVVAGSQKWESGGNAGTTNAAFMGGPCDIFAAAGTYTVSVQFKASSGSVTASNRKLWVEAQSFA